MATANITTEVVRDRVSDQVERLLDLQSILAGAISIDRPRTDHTGRLLRVALDLLDDIALELADERLARAE